MGRVGLILIRLYFYKEYLYMDKITRLLGIVKSQMPVIKVYNPTISCNNGKYYITAIVWDGHEYWNNYKEDYVTKEEALARLDSIIKAYPIHMPPIFDLGPCKNRAFNFNSEKMEIYEVS